MKLKIISAPIRKLDNLRINYHSETY